MLSGIIGGVPIEGVMDLRDVHKNLTGEGKKKKKKKSARRNPR